MENVASAPEVLYSPKVVPAAVELTTVVLDAFTVSPVETVSVTLSPVSGVPFRYSDAVRAPFVALVPSTP